MEVRRHGFGYVSTDGTFYRSHDSYVLRVAFEALKSPKARVPNTILMTKTDYEDIMSWSTGGR
jgi:hypothetical protein